MTKGLVDKYLNKTVHIILPVVILLVGVTLMILGIVRGETQEIFRKAIRVCLECIGIG